MADHGWVPVPGETPIDLSGLKIAGVTNRRELSVVEAANIRLAVVKFLGATPNRRTAPFTFAWCVRVHGEMFGDVWEWAGVIRTRDGFNLGVPWYTVRDRLAGLLGNLRSWSEYEMDLIEQCARLHYHAVQIHPFENGNGRWARLLSNIWLRLHGAAAVRWPESVIGDESEIRDEYISAVKAADKGDFEPIIRLHRRYSAPTEIRKPG